MFRNTVYAIRRCLKQNHRPDEGWCWVMFVCVCLNMFLVFGVHYTYGVIFPSILEEYNQNQEKTAWVGSLASGLLFLSSIAATKSCEWTNVMVTCLFGSVLSGVGIILTSVITNFEWLYLFYGMFFGIGSSFIYTPGIIMVTLWFKKYRGITTGIAASSAALGSVVLSPLIKYTIERNGLRATIKAGGIIYLFVSFTCSLSYFPLVARRKSVDMLRKSSTVTMLERDENEEEGNGAFLLDFHLFKNKSFCLYVVTMMITNFAYYIPIVFLVNYAEQIGCSSSSASYLITMWSVSNIVGRVTFGKLVSHQKKRTLRIYQIAMFLSGIVSVAATFSTRYWHLVCYVISYGFLDGSFIGLMPLVAVEVVSLKYLPQGYSIMFTSIGLPIACGPALIGIINDHNLLPPNSMFAIAGTPFIIGSLLMFLIIKWSAKRTVVESTIELRSDVTVEKEEDANYLIVHTLV